jgi:LysM repeat protein
MSMQNLRNSLLFFLLLIALGSRAQSPETIQLYINTYKDIAIAEMQRSGVPAAIKLAQGIHETSAGTSDLVIQSNNHFGIKCKATWTGESVNHDDDLRGECFRKYPSAQQSYRDHSDFLKGNTRYAFLFNLDPTDYQDWAYGLKKAGYATNPKYPQIIIKLIEDYHLEDYTLIALGKTPTRDDVAIVANAEVKEEPVNNTVIEPPVAIQKEEPAKVVEVAKPVEKIIEKSVYPEGEFKINETRAIYAKQGTSYIGIAEQFNVPLARVFEFNDMPVSETVMKDQLIYLQRKRKTGNNEYHFVQAGETLHDIAQQEAIRLETLLEYNLLQGDMKPAIGEQLFLRTKAPGAPRLAVKENYTLYAGNANQNNAPTASNGPTNNASFFYTVQPKETIFAISRRYNVSIDDIVKWNNLQSNDLKTGQRLKLYK